MGFFLAVPPIATISPAGGSGTPPTESAIVYGSGVTDKVKLAADEPRDMWVETTDYTITVFGGIKDRAWIKQVEFTLNGNTVVVTHQRFNPRTGQFGWCITPITGAGTDGDYTLYAKGVPYNGYEKLISIPLVLNTNGTISRAVRYLSVNGSNSNNGLTAETAWLTPNKAAATAPSGAIVEIVAAGTYPDTLTGFSNQNNARMMEFRLGAGLKRGDVIFTHARTRTDSYTPRARRSIYKDIAWDMALFGSMTAFPGADATLIFQRCDLIDSNGVAGTATGYHYNGECPNQIFVNSSGQVVALLECRVRNFCCTGQAMERNCDIETSADSFLIGVNQTNVSSWFTRSNQAAIMYQREHLEPTVTVSSSSFDGTHTTINWQGTPTFNSITADNPGTYVALATSSSQDASSGAPFHTQSAGVTKVLGNYTATFVNGAVCWIATTFHADSCQVNANSVGVANGPDNIVIVRKVCDGLEIQPIFSQPGPSAVVAGTGNITTVGTAASFSAPHNLVANDFAKLTNGSQSGESARVVSVEDTTHVTLAHPFTVDQSAKTYNVGKTISNVLIVASAFRKRNSSDTITQFQNGARGWLNVQVTHLGTGWAYRDVSSGFGLEDCANWDCLFESMSADNGFPSVGLSNDNNHYISGTQRGSNASGGAVTYDSEFRLTGGLSKAISGNPLFPWALDGTPIRAGALVGAQQAAA